MKKFAKITAVALVVVLTVALLAACGYSSDPDKAAKALEKKGYTVVVVPNVTTLGNILSTVTATKPSEVIVITYYTDAAAAKEYWNSDVCKKLRENAKDNEDYSIKRSGNQIITVTAK